MKTTTACCAAIALLAPIPSAASSAPVRSAPPPAVIDLIKQEIGTWKLNLAESRDTSGLPYKQGFTVIIRSTYPIADYTFIGEAAKGAKPYVFGYKGIADGKVRPNGTGGATYSMELLPVGIMDAKLWSPNGELENKFCIPYASMRKIICLATVTTKAGKRTMFTNVLDKVSDSVR